MGSIEFGPFVIIQLGVVAIMAIISAIGFIRGRAERRPLGFEEGGTTQLFFGGPLVKALDLLEGIYRELREMRVDIGRIEQELHRSEDRSIGILEDIRDGFSEKNKRN